ncbi:hypothetical protein A4D02_28835 [Niastella koreensis]|nr:hypothetical protein [Niastella koreensis]OQP49599.1 hypothetical protein A4D02_28835 [Niastella koreensis]
MRFRKETIKNYRNAELDIFMERCQHYSLFDDNEMVGNFYCDRDNSIGILHDTFLVIKRIKSKFTQRSFELRNCNNNAIVGQLTISNFVRYNSLNVSLDIIHKEPYIWEVVEASRGGWVLPPTTYSVFLAQLYNNEEDLIIKWNYKSDNWGEYAIEELPVTGELELENPRNHFLLFAGLFLAEMELQMKAVD